MDKNTTFMALDAHKKDHRVAMRLAGGEKMLEWTVGNVEKEIRRMMRRVKRQAPGPIVVCYEAGPCGFALQRQIEMDGVKCMVVAPSLIPAKPGERVKTDRRDARNLLRLLESGLLTEVHAPTRIEEALRDLCRCRDTAKQDLKRAKHHLLKFLLRRGMIYRDGERNWTKRHFEWLRSLKFENRYDERTYNEYLWEVQRQNERVENLDKEISEAAEEEPYKEPVSRLRCFRGIDTVTAMLITAELYAIERFNSARELMNYVGLTPSEYSSGEKKKRGGISKAGNGRVRRLLVEAAWHQRHRPVLSKALRKRREGRPEWVIEIADRAMKRLHKKYWRLIDRGKESTVATTAIARETVGFIWSVLYPTGEIAVGSEG